jgi:predicted RNA binding protein YcfA (HicA-like mRNA interferase family)
VPRFGPISHQEFVHSMKRLGFEGPYHGGKHPFMRRSGRRFTIPNPHEGDIRPGFLSRLLRQADISREEWEAL